MFSRKKDSKTLEQEADKELERTKKNINFNEIDCIWLGANQYRFDEKQKAQIEDPNCDYYTISRLKWYYTFGTYAIGMNKHFIIENDNKILYCCFYPFHCFYPFYCFSSVT